MFFWNPQMFIGYRLSTLVVGQIALYDVVMTTYKSFAFKKQWSQRFKAQIFFKYKV